MHTNIPIVSCAVVVQCDIWFQPLLQSDKFNENRYWFLPYKRLPTLSAGTPRKKNRDLPEMRKKVSEHNRISHIKIPLIKTETICCAFLLNEEVMAHSIQYE